MFNWVIDETKSQKALQLLHTGITKKYTVQVSAEMQMGGALSKTLTQCRWVLSVVDVNANGYDMELLTVDNVMLETNNTALKDMVAINNVFSQMYNDLHFTVNKKGELMNIKNIAQLQNRWKHVRTELIELEGKVTSIEEVLRLNDELFINEKQLFDVIKTIEFLMEYMVKYCRVYNTSPKKVNFNWLI